MRQYNSNCIHSLVVCRQKNTWRNQNRTVNQLSSRFTFCSAKDETRAVGKGTPLTLRMAHTHRGGME